MNKICSHLQRLGSRNAETMLAAFISTLPSMHHATLLVRLDADRAEFVDPAYGKWFSLERGGCLARH